MYRFTSFVRRPVKRQGAQDYLLITLLSFAASISLTRLFLELTGYPQIRGGDFHIAHILWGGLLQFVAALLMLVFANRWVYTASAVLAGVGMGLFIDEVGKFITVAMDYHYPLAAPIVYAFFLLTVLVYLRVRQPPYRSARAELFRSFDAMEEILEHDLDPREREELRERLHYVAAQADSPQLALLANDLLAYLDSEVIKLSEQRSTIVESWLDRWHRFEARWLNRQRVKAGLAGGLLALGIVALSNMLMALPIGGYPASLERIITRLIIGSQLSSEGGLSWFLIRVGLESTAGLMLIISAGLLIANRDHAAVLFAYWSLLISLTVINMLVFYFDQFSAIITSIVQFGLLLGSIYYRRRYLEETEQPVAQAHVRRFL
jgi:hypothetical protein